MAKPAVTMAERGRAKLTRAQLAILAGLGGMVCLILGAAGAVLLWAYKQPPAPASLEVNETADYVALATPTRPAAAPAGSAKGWVTYGGREEGFTMALPSGWLAIDLEAETLVDALAPFQVHALHLEDPGIVSWHAGALGTERLKFAAIHAVEHDFHYYAVVDVRCERAEAPLSLEAVVQEAIYAYPDMGWGIVANEWVQLASGRAGRFELVTGTEDPRATAQYVLVEGRRACFVALSCDAQARGRYDETFDRIIESFRWVVSVP